MPPPDRHSGLFEDLERILTRRKALALLTSAVAAGVGSCDRLPFLSEAEASAVGPDGRECVAHPSEMAGPFPADGSNRAHGTLANVLADSGIVRRDMRRNLGDAGAPAEGVKLRLALTLISVGSSCTPLADHAIYLWHCDAAGQYSVYELPDLTYLRAVGVSSSAGTVEFETIVPGCYSGRYPHMHFEVYPNLTTAVDYRNRLLTSQLAVPAEACRAVYETDPAYRQSKSNFKNVSLRQDGIFRDNTPRQLAAQTLSMSRDSADGSYAGSVVIGLKA